MPTISSDIQAISDCVEQWISERKDLAAPFSHDGMRRFCEVMNYRSKTLVRLIGRDYPEFWEALAELSTNAATIAARAKLIVDHRDMTGV